MDDLRFPTRYTVEKLEYPLDWSKRLVGGETISAVVWDVPDGLTIVQQSNTTTVATVWLSGGDPDRDYELGCTITTTSTPARIDHVKVGLRSMAP